MLRQKNPPASVDTWSEDACLFPPACPPAPEVATVLITLTEDELTQCQDVARRLCEANYGRPDAAHYDRDKMQDDYFADTASNGCELAVAKYIGEKWHARVLPVDEHRREMEQKCGLPDVGDHNEVRRTRKQYVVAVRRRDAGKVVWGVQLPNELNLREYRLMGWVYADEALASGRIEWEEDGTWGYYPLSCLAPPETYFTR